MLPYSYLQKKPIGFQLGYRRLIIAIALLALPAFQKNSGLHRQTAPVTFSLIYDMG
jgi:hypothetical protein